MFYTTKLAVRSQSNQSANIGWTIEQGREWIKRKREHFLHVLAYIL